MTRLTLALVVLCACAACTVPTAPAAPRINPAIIADIEPLTSATGGQ